MTMVPPESSTLFSYGGGGGLIDGMMMRETIVNNQDSSGDACSISDPITASTNYYNISSYPVTMVNGSAAKSAKNDVVCCVNIEDKDKSWLRLGIGPEEEINTASYKLQNKVERDKSLELSLFSLSSTAAEAVSSSVYHTQPQPQTQEPPFRHHDQLLSMRGASLVYNNQLIGTQRLLNRGFTFPSSKPWIPQYTTPFRPSSLGMMSDHDVTNNTTVTRSCCVEERGAGPSSEFRVLDPPKRPHSGLWFLLQASQFQ